MYARVTQSWNAIYKTSNNNPIVIIIIIIIKIKKWWRYLEKKYCVFMNLNRKEKKKYLLLFYPVRHYKVNVSGCLSIKNLVLYYVHWDFLPSLWKLIDQISLLVSSLSLSLDLRYIYIFSWIYILSWKHFLTKYWHFYVCFQKLINLITKCKYRCGVIFYTAAFGLYCHQNIKLLIFLKSLLLVCKRQIKKVFPST